MSRAVRPRATAADRKPSGERRHLALLFTDVSGSTVLSSKMEPESYAELLGRVHEAIRTAVARHGGSVVRVDGDGALACFGYPLSHEDNGRRAVEAALDITQAIRDLQITVPGTGKPLAMHTGVHAGVVLVQVGDRVRGRYEFLGEATNVARRLCDHAQPGEIVISESALGADRDLFVISPRDQVVIEGDTQTVPVVRILGRSEHQSRFVARISAGLTPFVGRARERARLNAWLQAEGQSELVLHGPSGVGKSRLLREFLADATAAGWTVARGYCDAYLGAQPLQPVLQIAAALGLSPEAAHSQDPVQFAAALAGRAGEGGLLLTIDDWQWSDDASKRVIAELTAGDDPSRRLRVILTVREGAVRWQAPRGALLMQVPPLLGHDVIGIIKEILPGADSRTLSRIHIAAGGTPLLIEELCHRWREHGMLDPDQQTSLGAWYDMAVQARFLALRESDARMLQIASVIGNTVQDWLYARIAGTTLRQDMVDRLIAADFMFVDELDGTVRFKHELTREAIYAGIRRDERQSLHRHVMEALEARVDAGGKEDVSGLLAWHAQACEDRNRALAYGLKAAEAALALGALDRARANALLAFRQLDDSLRMDAPEATGSSRSLSHIIRVFGRATAVDPGRSNVDMLGQMLAAARKAADAEATSLASYWIGSQLYGLGESRSSVAYLKDAQNSVCESQAPGFAVQLLASLGQSYAIGARYGEALGHMTEAVDRKRQARQPGEPSVSLGYCLSSRGLVHADIGNFPDAHADFEASLDALQGRDDPVLASIQAQRCFALICQGRYAEAIDQARLVEDRADRAGAAYLLHSAGVLGSFAAWRLTGASDALERLRTTVDHLQRARLFQRIGFKYGWLAEAMARLGDVALARHYAVLAFRRALKGDRLGEASAARALALIAGPTGRRGPQHYLKLAARAAHKRGSRREAALNGLCEAQIALAQGDTDAAIQIALATRTSLLDLEMTAFADEASILIDEAMQVHCVRRAASG